MAISAFECPPELRSLDIARSGRSRHPACAGPSTDPEVRYRTVSDPDVNGRR